MTSEELSFFNKIAPSWDSMEVRSTPEKVAELLDIVKVKDGDDILDLGTGTGVLLPELSRRAGSSGSVVGVDFSEGMLAEAEKKCMGLDNVFLSHLDFEEEREPWRYDLVMLYCVYPHLSRPDETLRRLAKENLKEGGRIVIGFPTDENFINSIHHTRESEDDLHSGHLPSAEVLSKRIISWGLQSRVLAYGPDRYLVEVTVNG